MADYYVYNMTGTAFEASFQLGTAPPTRSVQVAPYASASEAATASSSVAGAQLTARIQRPAAAAQALTVTVPNAGTDEPSHGLGPGLDAASRMVLLAFASGRTVLAVYDSATQAAAYVAAVVAAAAKTGHDAAAALVPVALAVHASAESGLSATPQVAVWAGGAPIWRASVPAAASYRAPLGMCASFVGQPLQVTATIGLAPVGQWSTQGALPPTPPALLVPPPLAQTVFVVGRLPASQHMAVYASIWTTAAQAATFASMATQCAAQNRLPDPFATQVSRNVTAQLLSSMPSTADGTALELRIATSPALSEACPAPTARTICPTGAAPGVCSLTLPRGLQRSAASLFSVPDAVQVTVSSGSSSDDGAQQQWTIPVVLPTAPTALTATASSDGRTVVYATSAALLAGVFPSQSAAQAYTARMGSKATPGGGIPIVAPAVPPPSNPPSTHTSVLSWLLPVLAGCIVLAGAVALVVTLRKKRARPARRASAPAPHSKSA